MMNTSPPAVVRSGRLVAIQAGPPRIRMSMPSSALSWLVVIGGVLAFAPPRVPATSLVTHSGIQLNWETLGEIPPRQETRNHLGPGPSDRPFLQPFSLPFFFAGTLWEGTNLGVTSGLTPSVIGESTF